MRWESLGLSWKFLSRSAVLATGLIIANPALACATLAEGVYVQDDNSDAQLDGGKAERVAAQVNSRQAKAKYAGTTFNFGVAYLVKGGQATVFRVISNALDDKYEQLSITAPVDLRVDCEGRVTLDYAVSQYYPNEIRIGQSPTKSAKAMHFPMKVHAEGSLLPDRNVRLTKCEASEQRKSGWRKTDDDLGLCNGASVGYTLFNIQGLVKGKQGWDAVTVGR